MQLRSESGIELGDCIGIKTDHIYYEAPRGCTIRAIRKVEKRYEVLVRDDIKESWVDLDELTSGVIQ
jgi:hypothetical protein